jgi:hypothetical protein
MPRGVRLNPEHDERTRAKIQTSQLINRLKDHVFGKCELTATQVRAAEVLLRKSIPDLAAIQHSGELSIKRAADLTDDALANIAAGSGDRASEETPSKALLN